MDTKVCEKHDLYLLHRSGINTELFDSLLLTSCHHLKVSLELQNYFEKRNEASLPGLLEEDEITENSFSAKLPAHRNDMKVVIEEIRSKDEKDIEKKLAEVKAARENIDKMRAGMAKLSCTSSCAANASENQCTECQNAQNIQQQIKNGKISVYKVLMMPEKHKQNAIAFELRIPGTIACLRDVLYVFVMQHYDDAVGGLENGTKWTKNDRLASFLPSCGRDKTEYVFLGNSTKKTKSYTRSKHPESSNPDDFIIRDTNDYDCRLIGLKKQTIGKHIFSKMPIKVAKQTIKEHVTFSVEKSTVYEKLQWTIGTTKHTQNEVLASRSECPIGLKPAEYINFGSLRADGHRLQCRNLLRVITEESISFEMPSVLALVMQTLWESGPNPSATATWYRESNADFVDLNFVAAAIDQLETYIDRKQYNRQNPLKLLVVEIIICRLFELNSDAVLIDRLTHVLLKCRSIALAWILQLEASLKENHFNELACNQLNANLMEAGICGILTYFIDPRHQYFERVLDNVDEHSAVNAWLHFVATINHHKIFCKDIIHQVCTVRL